MDNHKSEFPIGKMAKVLGISRSGYYKYTLKGESKRSQENAKLSKEIKEIFHDSAETYGSPRVMAELHDRGYQCGINRVSRLMNEMNLVSCRHKKFKVMTTDSNHDLAVSPNLLKRNFSIDKPNKVWVSDITYISTQEGWLYLCTVLDLFSRKIVGWSMTDHMEASMVIDALDMAYMSRRPGEGLIMHSDRGSQYASNAFREKLAEYEMLSSMSRKGNCWDNACAESFFCTLKTELVYRCDYLTRDEAKKTIFRYIEIFYNRKRRHSTLGNVSPDSFEMNISA